MTLIIFVYNNNNVRTALSVVLFLFEYKLERALPVSIKKAFLKAFCYSVGVVALSVERQMRSRDRGFEFQLAHGVETLDKFFSHIYAAVTKQYKLVLA